MLLYQNINKEYQQRNPFRGMYLKHLLSQRRSSLVKGGKPCNTNTAPLLSSDQDAHPFNQDPHTDIHQPHSLLFIDFQDIRSIRKGFVFFYFFKIGICLCDDMWALVCLLCFWNLHHFNLFTPFFSPNYIWLNVNYIWLNEGKTFWLSNTQHHPVKQCKQIICLFHMEPPWWFPSPRVSACGLQFRGGSVIAMYFQLMSPPKKVF